MSNRTRFPLWATQGSEKQRFRNAEKMTYQLYKNMKGKEWTVDNFRNAIDEVTFPYADILCQIAPITKAAGKNLAGTLGVQISNIIENTEMNEIKILLNGFKMRLPIKGNKIIDKYTAFHEARHLFDHLYNPKLNIIRGAELDLTFDKVNTKIFNKIVYLFMKEFNLPIEAIKLKAIKRIEMLPKERRIDVLQSIRHNLKTEINAYNQALNIEYKDKPIINYIFKFTDKIINEQYFKFKKKLKIVNKIMKHYITKERAQNKNIYSK